jgi:hypothetical protein
MPEQINTVSSGITTDDIKKADILNKIEQLDAVLSELRALIEEASNLPD